MTRDTGKGDGDGRHVHDEVGHDQDKEGDGQDEHQPGAAWNN